jgi:hypothetical protein
MTPETRATVLEVLEMRASDLETNIDRWTHTRFGGHSKETRLLLIVHAQTELERVRAAQAELHG